MPHPHRDIADLTAIRAIFALWVLAYHIDIHTGFSAHLGIAANLLRRGYLGVDGFFVLSGFILATVHGPEKPSPGSVLRFYAKRLARLYPLHFTTIVLLAILYLAGRAAGIAPNDPARFAPGALIAHLCLVQGWGFVNHWSWNYPSWSISTEWAGYLVFPWLWFGVTRLWWDFGLTVPIVLVPIIGLIEYESPSHLNLTFAASLIRFAPEFLMGLSLARFAGQAADTLPGKAPVFCGLGCAALGVAIGYDVLVVTGMSLVIFGLAMRHLIGWEPVLPRALHGLGAISYAIYMSFAPAELVVSQAFRHFGLRAETSPALFALAMAGLTLALAIVLNLAVERPARAYLVARLVAKPVAV